jgi:hypothetical protein
MAHLTWLTEGDTVTRIPSHTIQDAPAAARPLLEGLVPFSPTGTLLNLHAQMAHSPVVLAAYAAIRQATVAHGTVFTAYFLNYAQTPIDLPAAPVAPGQPE